eukprot:scaffold3761_cov372-Prasinococcus_capsulatus_cf.AAC.6
MWTAGAPQYLPICYAQGATDRPGIPRVVAPCPCFHGAVPPGSTEGGKPKRVSSATEGRGSTVGQAWDWHSRMYCERGFKGRLLYMLASGPW